MSVGQVWHQSGTGSASESKRKRCSHGSHGPISVGVVPPFLTGGLPLEQSTFSLRHQAVTLNAIMLSTALPTKYVVNLAGADGDIGRAEFPLSSLAEAGRQLDRFSPAHDSTIGTQDEGHLCRARHGDSHAAIGAGSVS